MSIAPSYWGEPFWTTMYTAAQAYPRKPSADHRTAAIHFFESLQLLLPCIKCREEYVYLCYKYPIENYVRDRDLLAKWVNTIDNEIRTQNGKELRDLATVIADIEQHRITDEQETAEDQGYMMTKKVQQQGSAAKKTFVTRRTIKGYEIVPQRTSYYANSASPFSLSESRGSSGGGCGCM